MLLPYPPMPATTPARMRRFCGIVERTEAERVEQRDRPRAHREDVADDAADAGGRALVRLDERRVVVRFDLEDRGQPVADVHRAGVLTGSLQHARARGRQRPEVDPRALVAAVLGPHHREDAELREVGLPPHQRLDALVFFGGHAVAFERRLIESTHEGFDTRKYAAIATIEDRHHTKDARDDALRVAGDLEDARVDQADDGHHDERRPDQGQPTIRRFARLASSVIACSLQRRAHQRVRRRIRARSSRRRCRAAIRRPARGAASGRRRCALRLQMPAMFRSDPFGLASFVTSPVGET